MTAGESGPFSRREFLKVTGTAGGGLAVALALPGSLGVSSAPAGEAPGASGDAGVSAGAGVRVRRLPVGRVGATS